MVFPPSIAPWSSQDLTGFEQQYQVMVQLRTELTARYQAYPQDTQWPGLNIPPGWQQFAQTLPLYTSEGLKTLISGSSVLDQHIATRYIDLILRSSTTVEESQPLPQTIHVESRGLFCGMSIQPFVSGHGCGLLVTYADCVHWFTPISTLNEIPIALDSGDVRPIERGWTGPKGNENNSIILMLMGIRCLAAGYPHVDQRTAEDELPSFRLRMLLELLCGSLDPSDEALKDLQREVERRSADSNFCLETCIPQSVNGPHEIDEILNASPNWLERPFEPAQGSLPCSRSATTLSHESTLLAGQSKSTPAGVSVHPSARSHVAATVPVAPISGRRPFPIASPEGHSLVARRSYRSESLTSQSHTGSSPATSISHSSAYHEDMKTIVESLWQMVRDTRGREQGASDNLQTLWLFVQDERPSKFYAKYFGVRFYEKIEELENDEAIKNAIGDQSIKVNTLRTQAAKWKPLAEACRLFGSSDQKYVVLCAVRPGNEATDIQDRLGDHDDRLRTYLEAACSLFLKTFQSNLPDERLFIENYRKKQPPTNDEMYRALVSDDPRATLSISRIH